MYSLLTQKYKCYHFLKKSPFSRKFAWTLCITSFSFLISLSSSKLQVKNDPTSISLCIHSPLTLILCTLTHFTCDFPWSRHDTLLFSTTDCIIIITLSNFICLIFLSDKSSFIPLTLSLTTAIPHPSVLYLFIHLYPYLTPSGVATHFPLKVFVIESCGLFHGLHCMHDSSMWFNNNNWCCLFQVENEKVYPVFYIVIHSHVTLNIAFLFLD